MDHFFSIEFPKNQCPLRRMIFDTSERIESINLNCLNFYVQTWINFWETVKRHWIFYHNNSNFDWKITGNWCLPHLSSFSYSINVWDLLFFEKIFNKLERNIINKCMSAFLEVFTFLAARMAKIFSDFWRQIIISHNVFISWTLTSTY